jgi:hypothetical protein
LTRQNVRIEAGEPAVSFRWNVGVAPGCPGLCPVREPNRDLESVYLCGERCLFPVGHAGPHECAGHAAELPDQPTPEPFLIYPDGDRARPL